MPATSSQDTATNTQSTKPQRPTAATQAQLRSLVEEQAARLEQMQVTLDKVYRYIWWQRIWLVVKIVFVVVPVILGILYLPPLLENAFAPYQELLGGSSNTSQFELEQLLQDVVR